MNKPRHNKLLYYATVLWHKWAYRRFWTAQLNEWHWERKRNIRAAKLSTVCNILDVWGRDVQRIEFGPGENTSSSSSNNTQTYQKLNWKDDNMEWPRNGLI